MGKFFSSHSIIGIAIIVSAIAYLLLHRKAPSTISQSKITGGQYPNANVKVPEAQTEAPEYMTINQPTKTPTTKVDVSNMPYAENVSEENLMSIM